MDKGIFCISLDTELYWGVQDARSLTQYSENIINVNKYVVSNILELFQKHNIHATWAVVGGIFADSYQSFLEYAPTEELRPSYCCLERSPYDNPLLISEEKRVYWFAPQLVDKIQEIAGQEVGSHTFSHYYCAENGQTIDQFEGDCKAAIDIASSKGINIRSIVFPRNMVDESYLTVVKEYGISAYRGLESNWIHNSKLPKILMRAFRLLDSYVSLSGHNCHLPKVINGVVNVNGSAFLRPYNVRLSFLEWLKIKRIQAQMKYAAKHNMVYHLWWHPHNFGDHTEENLKNLDRILDYYDKLQEEYGMRSLNMGEIAGLVENK